METFVRVTVPTDGDALRVQSLLGSLREEPVPPGFETADGERVVEAAFEGDLGEQVEAVLRDTGFRYLIQRDDE